MTANKQLGRLIIELYDAIVPKTTEHFLKYCQHEEEENELNYKGTSFFRIFPGLFCLGGDVRYSNGLGGVPAFNERYFKDENFTLSYKIPGTCLKFTFSAYYLKKLISTKLFLFFVKFYNNCELQSIFQYNHTHTTQI